MEKSLFVIITIFFFFGDLSAQNAPGVPSGSIAKDSRDDFDKGIRIRSIELERIKKEALRSKNDQRDAESRKLNYSQIKRDFELIQNLQNQIIKTYTTGEEINFKRIGKLASELNECAGRLDTNLLLSAEKSRAEKNKGKAEPENVKDLIVILDDLIGNFVTNPVFQNLYVIEHENAKKADFDLQSIIRISDLLAQKATQQS